MIFYPILKIIDRNLGALHSSKNVDGMNPFDLIKLNGLITNISDYDAKKHGILSTAVQCYTRYSDIQGSILMLYVVSDNEMAVDTIFGHTIIK